MNSFVIFRRLIRLREVNHFHGTDISINVCVMLEANWILICISSGVNMRKMATIMCYKLENELQSDERDYFDQKLNSFTVNM